MLYNNKMRVNQLPIIEPVLFIETMKRTAVISGKRGFDVAGSWLWANMMTADYCTEMRTSIQTSLHGCSWNRIIYQTPTQSRSFFVIA